MSHLPEQVAPPNLLAQRFFTTIDRPVDGAQNLTYQLTPWCTPDKVKSYEMIKQPGDTIPVPSHLLPPGTTALSSTAGNATSGDASAFNFTGVAQCTGAALPSGVPPAATMNNSLAAKGDHLCWSSVGHLYDVAYTGVISEDGLSGGHIMHFKNTVMMYDEIVSEACIRQRPMPICIKTALANRHHIPPPCPKPIHAIVTAPSSTSVSHMSQDVKAQLKWILPLVFGILGEYAPSYPRY